MRAVRFHDFGVENLRVEGVADVLPLPGCVLIANEASTINPVDAGTVSGAMASNFPAAAKSPYTPGWDLCGRVVAVGDGVDGGLVGKRVVGFSLWMFTGVGTQASLVSLPVENVAVEPEGPASSGLTTVGLNGLTAWRAVDEVNPQPGETVLVTGAAGSVGGFATELLVAKGAKVVAAVSERDRATVLGLGAIAVVAREEGDLGSETRKLFSGGVDKLLDTASIGGPTLPAIRDGGRYVTVTVVPDTERGITATRIIGVVDKPALEELLRMVGDGKLHTPVAKEFAVEDVEGRQRGVRGSWALRAHRPHVLDKVARHAAPA